MSVLPRQSTTDAPGAIAKLPLGAIRAMRSPSTRTDISARGSAPVQSRSLAWSNSSMALLRSRSGEVLVEVVIGGDGRGGTVSGGADELPRRISADISGGEQTRAGGPHPEIDEDMAALVERYQAAQE